MAGTHEASRLRRQALSWMEQTGLNHGHFLRVEAQFFAHSLKVDHWFATCGLFLEEMAQLFEFVECQLDVIVVEHLLQGCLCHQALTLRKSFLLTKTPEDVFPLVA